ncbi:MAG: hypothetical protein IKT00_11515 [Prevotella sp.]|nr:hypothetical protein [Prevotella sp.]
MKRTLLIALSALTLSIGMPQMVKATTVQGTVMPGKNNRFTKKDKKAIKLIEKFYKKYYTQWTTTAEAPADLDKILTGKCIIKLRSNYDYDGEGLAMWLFWMMNTDAGEDAGHFVSRTIVPTGNGWYRVTNKHESRSEVLRIRVIDTPDGLKIDDVVNN